MSRRVSIAVFAALALCAVPPLPASAEVRLVSDTFWAPVFMEPGGSGHVAVMSDNAGNSNAGSTTLRVALPEGLTYDGTFAVGIGSGTTCAGGGTSIVTCSVPGGGAGKRSSFVRLGVDVALDAVPGLYQIVTTRSGGGQVGESIESQRMRIATARLGFGIDPDNIIAGAFDDNGTIHRPGADFTQAGGHPYRAQAALRVSMDPENFEGCSEPGSTFRALEGNCMPDGLSLSDIVATLPPGFVGDVSSVAQCAASATGGCPPESQIGYITLFAPALPMGGNVPIYNMQPPPGQPAQFAFTVPWAGKQLINPTVRADGDYGITMTASNISEAGIITRSNVVIWGTPQRPEHDIQRCVPSGGGTEPGSRALNPASLICDGIDNQLGGPAGGATAGLPSSSSLPERAFLSMPTNCADTPSTTLFTGVYENRPMLDDIEDPRWTRAMLVHPDHDGCENVPFDPTIDYEPQLKVADTPSGLDVHLNIPRDADRDENGIPDDSDSEGQIQAHLKKTTVTLPRQVAFNASAADGILGCNSAQIGLVSAPGQVPYRFNNKEPTCPSASKVANATVVTPVLDNPLQGEVFLAAQDDNPFGATYAIYIVVREPSILVKLPGLVEPDSATGQLKTTFDQNPQLPFSDLKLDFFGGPRAALANPKTCGMFTTITEFVPWSAADPRNPKLSEIVTSHDTFTIDQGASERPCVTAEVELPFDLGVIAGSTDPIAGQASPFTMQITRADGDQDIDRLEIAMPFGFTANLRGIPYCAETQVAATRSRSGKAEEADPACPVAAQIGTTLAGAGAGPLPLYRPGKLYLAGPYKGHPLSVVAVTPAVAGPFDLGNVVVRSALAVDPVTARVTALTDPLPQVFKGAPLRIRDVRININRPAFALNPTNCSELATEVRAFGANGGSDVTTNRYQVAGCSKLAFKPSVNLQFFGGVTRAKYQAVRAVVRPRPGDANISGAVVKFPTSAFVAQEHLNNICTRVQWAAEACPKGSIYGQAEAITPLLDEPLKGTVHLRSSSNLLPDLVADLRGPAHQPIKVEVAIKTDAVKGALRSTVQSAPDAPVTMFRLQTFGGKKGLIVNSRNICKGGNSARVSFQAHNGRRSVQSVPVRNAKCAKQRKAAKRKSQKRNAAKKRGALRD